MIILKTTFFVINILRRVSDDGRSTHLRTLACSGHNVIREAGVFRREAISDTSVSIPGESVTDGSRIRSFGLPVCVTVVPFSFLMSFL